MTIMVLKNLKKCQFKKPLQSLLTGALALCVVTSSAYAACSNPAATEGQIIYNGDENVPQVCTPLGWIALGILNPGAGGGGCTNPAGTEGEVVYNGDIYSPQYCDGDDWITMIGAINAGCNAPQNCSNVGDVCADGSLFAGFVTSPSDGSCRVIFVTNNNQGSGVQWKNATGADDISTDSMTDGSINHANRAGTLTDFPAFDLCESNSYHGKSDWYLPSADELDLLWLNRAAVNANAAGNFTTNIYWSSTEGMAFPTIDAYTVSFDSDGSKNDTNKTGTYDVRCIRSVASTPIGGGGGAPTGCPNIGEVCSDGTVYAGLSPDGNVPMYTTPNDVHFNAELGSAIGGTGNASTTAGEANTAILALGENAGSDDNMEAGEFCYYLGAHGHNDWYLPAQDELNVLYTNRVAIDNFDLTASGYYWSSTESPSPTSRGCIQYFNDGNQDCNSDAEEYYDLNFRCVRK